MMTICALRVGFDSEVVYQSDEVRDVKDVQHWNNVVLPRGWLHHRLDFCIEIRKIQTDCVRLGEITALS